MKNPPVSFRTASVDHVKIFYREAGDARNPAVLLLHGFPSSSHMYRALIPRLAERYHVIAPDLPGFGFSDAPDHNSFAYTFGHLAEVMEKFVDQIGLQKFALYIFDYGAPVGLRMAARHPERILALISQNGNAYEEGLSDAWAPIRTLWNNPAKENRDALRPFFTRETTTFQYTCGVAGAETRVAPEAIALDQALLDRPQSAEIQLDLLSDYKNNVALYPKFQEYFRTHRPPTLAVWGRNDPFFLAAGAQAFQRDNPSAEVVLLDTGHFALETHAGEIGEAILEFLGRQVASEEFPQHAATGAVREFYAALSNGDATRALALLHPEVEWTEAEGFPYYSGTWRGPEAVRDNLLKHLVEDWQDFSAQPHRFVSEGNLIVSFGAYSGTFKKTGKSISAPFAHLWKIRDGKLGSFNMYTDTAKILEALH